jgi:hypothetical protein
MIPNKVGERVGEPHHVNVVVHDVVSQLKNLQQVPWPARGEIEESLHAELRTGKGSYSKVKRHFIKHSGGSAVTVLTWDPNLWAAWASGAGGTRTACPGQAALMRSRVS